LILYAKKKFVFFQKICVLAGKFKGKNLMKIDVQDEENLKFTGFEVKEPEKSVVPKHSP